MSRVEAFATGIKIESSDQSPFQGLIDQGDLLAVRIIKSGMQGCNSCKSVMATLGYHSLKEQLKLANYLPARA